MLRHVVLLYEVMLSNVVRTQQEHLGSYIPLQGCGLELLLLRLQPQLQFCVCVCLHTRAVSLLINFTPLQVLLYVLM
jgi:hypothetical protein